MSGRCCGRPRCSRRGTTSRPGRSTPPALDGRRGRRDQGRGPAAGGRRAAVRDRRGVPPRAVARRLPVRDPRDRAGRARARRCRSTRRTRQITWTPNVTRGHRARSTWTTTIFGDHFTFLKRHGDDGRAEDHHPVAAAWRTSGSTCPGRRTTDHDEFRADVAAVYAAEVAGLYALGCRYLQFDDTIFAFLNDPQWRANARATGLDPDHQHEINVDGDQRRRCADKPADMAVTLHMCRGNYRSAWFSSGGYDFVAEDVFGGLKVDGLFLEYDDERSGTFEPLRFVPDDQVVVLGRDDHQDAGARVQGHAQAAGRGGRQVRGHRPAVHLRAVRVRVHRGGQRAHHRRGAGQARPAGRDRREIWG